MLSIKGLNQFYGGSHILWNVDMQVPEGSCTCLMGRNGMGKTTLLKCIMGILPATSGAIELSGTDLRTRAADDRARLGIGYVPQGREIFPRRRCSICFPCSARCSSAAAGTSPAASSSSSRSDARSCSNRRC
jgi:ABC-type branched-subunit amino acid transport system ATPase component